MGIRGIALFLVTAMVAASGQTSAAGGSVAGSSLAAFPLEQSGPVLRQHVEAGQPFTVAGLRGVLLGEQEGSLEAWVLPVKLLSHLTVEAEVEGYPVPLDLNTMAREIEVRPDRTTITYSHIALTLRQGDVCAGCGESGGAVCAG